MAKRFKNLDAALKYLRTPGAGADAIGPDAPAGSQLKKYQDYKAGKIKVSYPRTSTSNPGQLDEVAVKPFGLPSTTTARYIVGISRRAKADIAESGLNADALNVSLTDLPEGSTRVIGFTPATATVRIITGTTGTPTPSKITGNSYKKKTAKSYTYPFGSDADAASYSAAKSAIYDAVTNGNENRGVSFKPEILR
jgi:hypothetical protein